MKALTLWQPWATLCALEEKQYETRAWTTGYRGPLVIHAAKRFEEEERDQCHREPFLSAFKRAGIRQLSEIPLGAGLCVANLVDVVPTEQIRDRLSEKERAFGNYTDGHFAWQLQKVRRFPGPIPMRGRQGLWAWPMHKLYTFGYTGSTPEILRALAQSLDAVVVDIRFSPRSRVVHWNKAKLQQLLGGRYAYLQALGNRNYKSGGPIEFVNLTEGTARVIEMLTEKAVILLCGCKDVAKCHRWPAAEAVAEYGAQVEHL